MYTVCSLFVAHADTMSIMVKEKRNDEFLLGTDYLRHGSHFRISFVSFSADANLQMARRSNNTLSKCDINTSLGTAGYLNSTHNEISTCRAIHPHCIRIKGVIVVKTPKQHKIKFPQII
jgi:hypothetical protein